MVEILLILGSTREGRMSEKVGNWLVNLLNQRSDAKFELVDLRDYPLPFYDENASPRMLKDQIPVASSWREKIESADGYLVITPEYNHGYPAVLKNAFDYVYSAWGRKPIAFASYGSVGGVRSVEQLKQVAVELQMAPIQHSLTLQNVFSMFDENGKVVDDSHDKRANDVVDQLLWWAEALKDARIRK